MVCLIVLTLTAPDCSKKSPSQPEQVVSGPTFDLTFPAQGFSNELVFTEAGDWDYDCRPHEVSGMRGQIRVRESSTRDSALVAVGDGGLKFNPDSVTIKLGGRVRWVNVSPMLNHTVTRP
jgi:plastocyanin